MSVVEQLEIKTKYYNEALRYMDNAKETLKQAGKEDRFYKDDKYVKTACGTAYNGVLKAMDCFLLIKGVEIPKGRKKVGFYEREIYRIDKKLGKYFDNAYDILHLYGYYDGNTSVKLVKEGFDIANVIIEKIKP